MDMWQKALDLAGIFDYWGREPGYGETLMREKGDKGLASPIYLLMAVTHFQPPGHSGTRDSGRAREGWGFHCP
ncbi:mCG1026317 [Mus musculus]|nr:mCG1026317 [Mus musculus]